MEKRRTSVFENGLIWFGAAVSVAEILTGTYFAPLGFKNGLAAIILGHIIGFAMLFLAGLIGGISKKSSMESAAEIFGRKGGMFFALLNIFQLVGWTGIMIYDGALAADCVLPIGKPFWCLMIGGLIVVWILIGIKNLGVINTAAMAALFVLTVILSITVFRDTNAGVNHDTGITFAAAVELSVAMPLSWLPLIGDYTREAEKPLKATAVSAVTYSVVSVFMYVIGMGAAIFTGETEIARIMMQAGMGIVGLLIIVLSTVTTTFLDAYSSGVSAEALSNKISGKAVAVAVTVIGVIGALLLPLNDITDFLYFIGSVFAPMIAVEITVFFVLKTNVSAKISMVSWLVGFIAYRLLMRAEIPISNTLPAMLITSTVCICLYRIFKTKNKLEDKSA